MSSNTPSSPDPNQPQPGNPPPSAPTEQYQPLQPTQQFPAQPVNGQPQNLQPQNLQPQNLQPQNPQPGSGDARRYGIVAAIAVATAVLTIGIVFAILALTGGDDDDATASAPSQSATPTAPASPAGTAAPAATTPAATTAAATTAPGTTFPPGYTVHKGDSFGFQQPSGWVVKSDANSTFFPDAPIIEAAQANVAFWNDPANHPAEPGFSVTDLSGTPTTPADFINKVSQTTQRAVCANVAGYATSFSRGDWVGLRLDSGLCSDTNGETTLISATRQSDNAKIALLIRGPAPTTATFNQAMNAFDSYRS